MIAPHKQEATALELSLDRPVRIVEHLQGCGLGAAIGGAELTSRLTHTSTAQELQK